jgi:hypothetical protein
MNSTQLQMNAILKAAGVPLPTPGGMSVALFPQDLNMIDMASDEATQLLMMNGTDLSNPPKLLGVVSFGAPTKAQILAAANSTDPNVLACEYWLVA